MIEFEWNNDNIIRVKQKKNEKKLFLFLGFDGRRHETKGKDTGNNERNKGIKQNRKEYFVQG